MASSRARPRGVGEKSCSEAAKGRRGHVTCTNPKFRAGGSNSCAGRWSNAVANESHPATDGERRHVKVAGARNANRPIMRHVSRTGVTIARAAVFTSRRRQAGAEILRHLFARGVARCRLSQTNTKLALDAESRTVGHARKYVGDALAWLRLSETRFTDCFEALPCAWHG